MAWSKRNNIVISICCKHCGAIFPLKFFGKCSRKYYECGYCQTKRFVSEIKKTDLIVVKRHGIPLAQPDIEEILRA